MTSTNPPNALADADAASRCMSVLPESQDEAVAPAPITVATRLIASFAAEGVFARYRWESAGTAVVIEAPDWNVSVTGACADGGDTTVDYPATERQHRGLLAWSEPTDRQRTGDGEIRIAYDSQGQGVSLADDIPAVVRALRPYWA
ncbi:hypothetical protein [Streptomyces sp. NBC_01205]|uniref:hypothetical protein n=1 Tax=Streptomyces sp. NBC_01205 TaxID=2903771 RepID=UPI002E1028B2|nr:hypothetical protein OG573_43160 [Streptomyces sp. NBC_01205]